MRVGIINERGNRLHDRYSDEKFFAESAENYPDRIYFFPECWENIIASLRYKPGWTIEYEYAIDYDMEYVNIRMRVPDRDDPTKITYVGQKFILLEWLDEKYAREFLRRAIQEVELHEVDESILFDGERVFDPHKEK